MRFWLWQLMRLFEMKPLHDGDDDYVSLSQGLAYILGAILILLPSEAYWRRGAAIALGNAPFLKLCIIGAVGGGLSFACYVGRSRWIKGALSGLLGGTGVQMTLLLYSKVVSVSSLTHLEIFFGTAVGLLPGVLLFFWMDRRNKNQDCRN